MRFLHLLPVALACGACSDAGAAMVSRAKMDHGISLGAEVAATPLACLGGGDRTVGARGETQVVTFATPYDCSQCTPHMTGALAAIRRAGLEEIAFWVVWAPNPETVERSLLAQTNPGLPVCVNVGGSLWDLHDLQHTPFTAVIQNGKVVYLHDGTFSRPEEQARFVADLKALFRSR